MDRTRNPGPGPCRKPNFFILGAGKCGTTTLYDCLRRHPGIFLPAVKEPSFFCESFQVVANPVDYFRLFQDVDQEEAVGEASHVYMSNPSSAGVLCTLFPEARFVVILRNPVDRAYSLYHHMRRTGYERAPSFEKALRAEEQRVASRSFSKKCRHYYWNYLYFRSGLFGSQIERFFSLFDPGQFHFLTLDQLRGDPEASFQAIFRFLGVDPGFQPGLFFQNKGATARMPFFLRPFVTGSLLRRSPWLVARGQVLLEKFFYKDIPPMRQATRTELQRRYRPDLQKLKALTGLALEPESRSERV